MDSPVHLNLKEMRQRVILVNIPASDLPGAVQLLPRLITSVLSLLKSCPREIALQLPLDLPLGFL